jgi:chemotaxis protein CheZ
MSGNNANDLKPEILKLFAFTQKIRNELAAIRKPGEETDRFNSMSQELDAIVAATEEATNTILESVEEIDAIAQDIRAMAPDNKPMVAKLDAIGDRIGAVFEACTFQDITGQRVSKVVTSLKFIDEKLNTMVSLWGKEELARLSKEIGEDVRQGDSALLNGPQLKGKGVSQDDIDRLFD